MDQFITIIEKNMVCCRCGDAQLAAFLMGYINGLWNAGAISTAQHRLLKETYVIPTAEKALAVPDLNHET